MEEKKKSNANKNASKKSNPAGKKPVNEKVEDVAVVGLEEEEQEINLIALQNGHMEQNRERLVSTWKCLLTP